jgi:DNA-binding CsgD family transcriptional regulator
LVEQAYAVAGPDSDWLRGIAEMALPLLSRGLGVGAWTFDVSDPNAPRISTFEVVGAPEGLSSFDPRDFVNFEHGAGARIYLQTPPVATASEVARRVAFPYEKWLESAPAEARDFLAVVGRSPEGRGAILGAFLPERCNPTRSEKSIWPLISAHLVTAFRLRCVLKAASSVDLTEMAEAVLEPGGVCVHAENPAKSANSREALRRAAVALDRARGALRRSAPQEALEIWKGLTDGRWSLIDRFESDGRRFILAFRNDPRIEDPRVLTPRERQIAAFAAMGHSLKYIGYELGLSAKTVSFHLQHALAKLAVRSRAELSAIFLPKGAPGE